jgi:hypothetical protein
VEGIAGPNVIAVGEFVLQVQYGFTFRRVVVETTEVEVVLK